MGHHLPFHFRVLSANLFTIIHQRCIFYNYFSENYTNYEYTYTGHNKKRANLSPSCKTVLSIDGNIAMHQRYSIILDAIRQLLILL